MWIKVNALTDLVEAMSLTEESGMTHEVSSVPSDLFNEIYGFFQYKYLNDGYGYDFEKLSDAEINDRIAENKAYCDHPPMYYIDGLIPSVNSDNPEYQIDISPGMCRNSDMDGDICLDSSITIDITASGKNGLDSGSENADTFYYIWIIYNPTTGEIAGLLSSSSTLPTMPDGFNRKRRIGSVLNNNSSDFEDFKVENDDCYRHVLYASPKTILNNGQSSSYDEIDCSSYIPVTSRMMGVIIEVVKSNNNCRVYWKAKGDTYGEKDMSGYDTIRIPQQISLSEDQIFEYKVTTGSKAKVEITGYREEL
jgi:hypothetical protein